MTRLDLDTYLRRIGHSAPCRPDRQTLDWLIARHASAIPFENIEPLAGRVPSLDPINIEQKLLRYGRGGYCYEQNSLLLAALQAIGFDALPLEARVRRNVPPKVGTGRTHMAVRVVLQGIPMLADVGFGGFAPLAAVAFDGQPQRCTDGAVYRLVPHEDGSALQIRTAQGWQDCYRVGLGVPQRADLEIGNWYVATHPAAFINNNLLVSRAVNGGRLTLLNYELSLRTGSMDLPATRQLATRSEVSQVISDQFGIRLDPSELERALDKIPSPPVP